MRGGTRLALLGISLLAQTLERYVHRRTHTPARAESVALKGSGGGCSHGAEESIAVLSVIVPCYNHGATLRRALDSIVVSTQSLQEWCDRELRGGCPQVEVVVVDDDSSDTTASVARAFQEVRPLPFTYRTVEYRPPADSALGDGDVRPRRPGAARNHGVRSSRGDVLLYLDADDTYHASHLQRVFRLLRSNSTIGYVKTRMEFQIPMHPHWHHIIENVSPINGAVRRSLHDLMGGYLDLPDAEDASYWNMVRALAAGEGPTLGDTPTCVYWLTPGNHLDTQRDKFAHPPEAWDLFEEPTQGERAAARRRAEVAALDAIRTRVIALTQAAMKAAGTSGSGALLPSWLTPTVALLNVGHMFKALSEWDRAIKTYSYAATADRNNVMAYYSQGVLFSKGGKASDAEKAYVAGLRRRPDHPPSLYNLAVLQRDSGRAAEAEANYRRALAAEPDYALALNGLATLLWDLPGREGEAKRVFDTAVQQHPTDATLLNNLGGFHLRRGELVQAEELFRRSLESSPGFPSAAANLEALLKARSEAEQNEQSKGEL